MVQGVYVDILLVTNFFVNILLLSLVEAVCGRTKQRWRKVASAFAASLFSDADLGDWSGSYRTFVQGAVLAYHGGNCVFLVQPGGVSQGMAGTAHRYDAVLCTHGGNAGIVCRSGTVCV